MRNKILILYVFIRIIIKINFIIDLFMRMLKISTHLVTSYDETKNKNLFRNYSFIVKNK